MLLDTPLVDFGAPAPAFSLPDLDGTRHTLESSMGPNGLLVAFICNHCPYVKAVIDRLVADARELEAAGVNTVAIMPNDYRRVAADSPPQMRLFAERHGMGFPYLLDEDQSVARAFGAVCTPDFFGYNAAGELQYRGRIDSALMGPAQDRVPELLNGMRLVAETGAGPAEQDPSMGCSIKWR
jgi:peroxiredoxin